MRTLLTVFGLGLCSCAATSTRPSTTPAGALRSSGGMAPAHAAVAASATSRSESVAPDGSWDLGHLLAESERRNPSLAAERREIDVATAQVWEASLYPNPSLVVEYEDGRWLNEPPWRATHRVGVRLPLVVGGRVRAARAAAEADRDVAALRYTWRRREILSEVRAAYAALLGARRVREAARASRDVAQSAVSTAKARLEAQVAPEADVLKASVDLARSETELAEAEQRVVAAGRSLVVVSAVAELDPARVLGEIPEGFALPSWAEVERDVPSRHPLIIIAQREQEAARLRVDEANALRRADWTLEAKGGVNEDGDGVVSLGLEIPLPIRDNGSARTAVAEARRMVAVSRIEAARNEVLRRLSTLHRSVVLAQERVRRYAKDVLPPAREALEQTRFGHEKGKFTYLEVLDAQRTLSEATAAYATALSELYQAVAEFESYSGVEIKPQP